MQAEMNGSLHGARICKRALTISHIFFVDDSLIFGRANNGEVEVIQNIIYKYSEASRQRVNFDKSEITFSRNLPHEKAYQVDSLCGVKVIPKHSIYLGLPTTVGRSNQLKSSNPLASWKTNPHQIYCPDHPLIHHELFSSLECNHQTTQPNCDKCFVGTEIGRAMKILVLLECYLCFK